MKRTRANQRADDVNSALSRAYLWPLAHAGPPEVAARIIVAYARWQLSQGVKHTPGSLHEKLYTLVPTDDTESSVIFRAALDSMVFACRRGVTLSAWATGVIVASRVGYDWRRCLYPDYKATRRTTKRSDAR
jgi:hypothetical protein